MTGVFVVVEHKWSTVSLRSLEAQFVTGVFVVVEHKWSTVVVFAFFEEARLSAVFAELEQ